MAPILDTAPLSRHLAAKIGKLIIAWLNKFTWESNIFCFVKTVHRKIHIINDYCVDQRKKKFWIYVENLQWKVRNKKPINGGKKLETAHLQII